MTRKNNLPPLSILFLFAMLILIGAPLKVKANSSDILAPLKKNTMPTKNTPQNQVAPKTPDGKAGDTMEAIAEGRNAQTPYQEQQSYEAPYPFTSDELWQKILKVVELPEGYVTKQQVESIFDVRLQLIDQSNWQIKTDYPWYSVKRGRDWYFDLVFVEESPTLSHFNFDWGQDPTWKERIRIPPPPAGMCILANDIMPDIELRGWKLKYEHRELYYPPYSNIYTKGKLGQLELVFSSEKDNCLMAISVAVVRKPEK